MTKLILIFVLNNGIKVTVTADVKYWNLLQTGDIFVLKANDRFNIDFNFLATDDDNLKLFYSTIHSALIVDFRIASRKFEKSDLSGLIYLYQM